MITFDPIQVEVWRHLLASIAEEMGGALERTAYSPNIKERLDHSCALFNDRGELLAQAAHIPVHLGAMPLMLRALKDTVAWSPGLMILCNDPRVGGTHLPDLTLVAPVYEVGGEDACGIDETRLLLGFVASRAHHADIGGLSPGSLPLSKELFHEGLILPPMTLVKNGVVQEEVVALVCANSRTPAERRGDLSAQIAANETGIARFCELVVKSGLSEFKKRTSESIAYAESAIREMIAALPPGEYPATDFLDDDGADNRDIPIRVRITITKRADLSARSFPEAPAIRFDFTGSSPQVRGSLNATEAITRSACCYLIRCLVEEEIPTNEGCFTPIEVIAPEGTIVNAKFPAAVAGGNVETSQRIVDTLLKAFAQILPDRIPAMSQGTMNNLTIGGFDPIRNRPFAYYETMGGGAGASRDSPGASAIHTHMTNTRNTPIESFESHYPMRVMEYSIAEGTGGQGAHCGGDGLIRKIELLAEAHVTLLTERRIHAPPGISGGENGVPGENSLTLADETVSIPGKWSGECPAGTILTIRTPGGGGMGAKSNEKLGICTPD